LLLYGCKIIFPIYASYNITTFVISGFFMRKLYIFIIIVYLFSVNANAENIDTAVKAKACVLTDLKSGRILWQRNADMPLAMASTTKIMTAITILETVSTEDIVTVSKKASSAPPVKIYLETGENIRVMDLLYALMLCSANDSAVALAEYGGGSVENFCDIMTRKAWEIGCKDTVFETPNGLDTDNHHSTAEDMSIIARYAMQNEDFRKLIATEQVNFKSDRRSYNIVNKNRLLSEYDGATGIKTGYTGKAGHCFVGSAKRGDMELISVCLASGWGQSGKQQKWIDAKALLDYGFDNYKYYTVIDRRLDTGTVEIENGKAEKVETELADSLCVPLTEEEKDKVRIEYNINKTLYAPVSKGDKCGVCTAYIGEEMLGSVDIYIKQDIEEQSFGEKMKKRLAVWLDTIFKNPKIQGENAK
jgi:D-alanyl-D-alanine carboxypeptidase (penicillin-binding protein 5/6)